MDSRQFGKRTSALVLGGGPAGLLSALVLAGRGIRVSVIDPRLHRPTQRPQSQHVHLLEAATWRQLCALAPGLEREVARLNAPCGYGDGDTLDARGRGPKRPFPDRWMIDAGLEALCARRGEIELIPTTASTVRHTPTGWQGSALRASRFDLLVDCSGTIRESLGALENDRRPEVLATTVGGGHASMRVTGVHWPAGIVGHSARSADGLSALLLRRCSRAETLITWQLPDSVTLPDSGLLDAVHDCPDRRVAALIRAALPASPVHRWRSRRMSVLGLSGNTPDHWLALGDALLTTPPELGQGLAQLIEQAETLAHGLATGEQPRHIFERLVGDARERFYAASMAQLLQDAWQPVAGDHQARVPSWPPRETR